MKVLHDLTYFPEKKRSKRNFLQFEASPIKETML